MKARFNEDGDFEDFPDDKSAVNFSEVLREMMKPFQPAYTEAEADRYFTTKEIIAGLEAHYGFDSSDSFNAQPIYGPDVVDIMHELGFKAANIGGAGMHWLLKKK